MGQTKHRPKAATVGLDSDGRESVSPTEMPDDDWAPKPDDPVYPAYLRHRARMSAIRRAFDEGGARAAYEAARRFESCQTPDEK